MDHFTQIYTSQAAAYQRMIAAEDADGRLANSLDHLVPSPIQRALDLGTGTGRLPLLLAKKTRCMVGLDLQNAMLAENRRQMALSRSNWALLQADMRRLPFPGKSFDLVTAGWAIGHLTGWHPAAWQGQVDGVLQEMLRVATPGGLLIIIETMSTGQTTPAPPTAALGAYYDRLERHFGFEGQVLATDYVFPDSETAAESTGFFFGEELAGRIRRNRWRRLPEFTGVWARRV